MRTSSTLLCFLALTCWLAGCQKGEEERLILSLYARWPAGMVRSESYRKGFLRRWRHTEVEVEDAEGRKERLQFPGGADLRPRPLAQLSLEKGGVYTFTVRLNGGGATLLEGRREVKVETGTSRADISLRAP